MKIAVRDSEGFVLNLHTRMPFRYGIATMTRVPHFILQLTVEIDGRSYNGFAADNLAPKWFTKNPETSYPEELAEIFDVTTHAREAAIELGPAGSPFEFWTRLYEAQKSWAAGQYPPLLWNFGVTLVERALIDAFCRSQGATFAQVLRDNRLGTQLGYIFPELSGIEPAQLLPKDPLRSIAVRHTVGLTDPLTDTEITEAEQTHDGLPASLDSYLQRNGIDHLKIKLSGNVERDLDRLSRLSTLVETCGVSCAFTLDGNENFHEVEPFVHLWERLHADSTIANFMSGLIFVEQPFHRSVALTPETCAALRAWKDRPPIIIDESDAEIGTLQVALEGGYAGTSHKNCKGIFKGIANACLIAKRRQANPDAALHMSAEDLTNVGPLALLQDLAVLASLGIPHAERNATVAPRANRPGGSAAVAEPGW